MDATTEIFRQYRPRLMGIAYRMLGSRADAEDMLQDAYIRWIQSATAEIRSPEAWLVTIVTRLNIDRLRLAKKEREGYTGQWIPEPWLLEKFIAAARAGDHAQLMELFAEDVTVTGDGGGKVPSILEVLRGARRATRFYLWVRKMFLDRMEYHIAEINGMPGILRYLDGKLESATSVSTDGQHILDIYIVRNPDELRRIKARSIWGMRPQRRAVTTNRHLRLRCERGHVAAVIIREGDIYHARTH